MLTQIVINDQHIITVFHPFLADCTTCIRRNILQRSRFTCGGGYNGRILHGTVGTQLFYDLCYRTGLLTNGNIDAFYIVILLIDNRINGNRRFSRLAISDDQLTLTAADWNHGINDFQAGLNRLMYTFSCHNTGCHTLYRTELITFNRFSSVNCLSKCIDNTSQHTVPNGNLYDTTGTFYFIAFTDVGVIPHQNSTDVLFLQVQYHSINISGKTKQLTGHRIL